MAIVTPIALLPTRSSSGTCWFADQDSAFIPSAIDSARFMTPRSSGTFEYFSAQLGASCTSTSIAALGVAHRDGPVEDRRAS